MPDLLFELFSEEIPARMQARAAEDLRKAVTDRLVDAGLVYEGAKTFVTPRRLALAVHGVPNRQADVREEKKGPRVGAPENAIAGFLAYHLDSDHQGRPLARVLHVGLQHPAIASALACCRELNFRRR